MTASRRFLPALLLLVAVSGCAKSPRSFLAANTESSAAPVALSLVRVSTETFRATLNVDAPAGARVFYALDPANGEDVRWIPASSSRISLMLAPRTGAPYVLLAKTIAPDGVESPVVRQVFTADNVLAQARVTSPIPTHHQPVSPPPTFRIRWTGTDPEAPGGMPAGYLTRLALPTDINPDNPLGITRGMVDEYFRNDLRNNRSAWTETADTTHFVNEVPVNTVAYFAVTALDAGGDGSVDSTFDLDRNVLWFRPTDMRLGPDLTVTSALFRFTKSVASTDPAPYRTVSLRAGTTLDASWSAIPDIGFVIDGYRWAVDPVSSEDTTPRHNERDLEHWSDWSLAATHATIGPFAPGDAKKDSHQLWIEVRDDVGFHALAVIEFHVLGKARPPGQLLLIDDLFGTPTARQADGTINYVGPYPMEAEQDSFYNAVGGVPDELRRRGVPGADPNALSLAGAFAGFDYDTLDYRFWPADGIDIETLSRYRAVAWYTNNASASRTGGKFSTTPATALRRINTIQMVNHLAEYSANGGKVWLFGDGAATAIANGFWSRYGAGAARLPYSSTEGDMVLRPGNFLYDFIHIRSRMTTGGLPAFPTQTANSQLHGCIPYLPQFAGPASQGDRTHDPRIGPSSVRTAERWSDLPRLTIAAYRGADSDPALRGVPLTWCIDRSLSVIEGEGRRAASTVDTLYLFQARVFDPARQQFAPSDGFPNAIDYHGADNGEIVWFGFPLYVFELDQARQVVRAVMRNFGIEPLPPGVRQGPGSVEPPASEPAPVAAAQAR